MRSFLFPRRRATACKRGYVSASKSSILRAGDYLWNLTTLMKKDKVMWTLCSFTALNIVPYCAIDSALGTRVAGGLNKEAELISYLGLTRR